VADQKPAIESQRQMTLVPASRDTVAVYLPLILSVAGALVVAPFVVIRWMNGDWIIATIDTAIVSGFVILGVYIFRTKKVRGASIVLAVLCALGALVTIYVRGVEQTYWAFPAVMASFYLLRPREAIVLTLSLNVVILPKLIQDLEPFVAGTISMTMLVTAAFAYVFSVINTRQQEQLLSLATKDPLTGAGNRRALQMKLVDVIGSFHRNGTPTSIIVLDLDHFKKVNDLHGHAAGDQILCEIVGIVNLRTRTNDSLFRIGGEEFLVVADGQGLEDASYLAEQLRTLVEANELVPGSVVTISLGVAELRAGEAQESWLSRADGALYEAKRDGRNLIRSAS